MDPHSGETFRLPDELPHSPGDTMAPEELEKLKALMTDAEDQVVVEKLIAEDRTAVAVSDQVAQQQALGRRELRRRRSRSRKLKGIAGS